MNLDENEELRQQLTVHRIGSGRKLHQSDCGHCKTARVPGSEVTALQACCCAGMLFSLPHRGNLFVTGNVVHVHRQCAQNTPGRVLTMQLCEHCNLMIPLQVNADQRVEDADEQWELVEAADGVVASGCPRSPG